MRGHTPRCPRPLTRTPSDISRPGQAFRRAKGRRLPESPHQGALDPVELRLRLLVGALAEPARRGQRPAESRHLHTPDRQCPKPLHPPHTTTTIPASSLELRTFTGACENLGVNIVLRGEEQLILDGPEDRLPSREKSSTNSSPSSAARILEDIDFSHASPVGSPAAKTPDASTIDLLEKAKKVTPRPGARKITSATQHETPRLLHGAGRSARPTFAVAMAVNALRRQQVRKIVLVRPLPSKPANASASSPATFLAKANPFLRRLLTP